MTKKITSRTDNKYHRQDVKFPLPLYEKLLDIAVTHFDAKTHHRSNKPELTQTIISLLQLGIESLEGSEDKKKLVNRLTSTDAGKPITAKQVQLLIDSAIEDLKSELNLNVDKKTLVIR